jgi:hypothetical protein
VFLAYLSSIFIVNIVGRGWVNYDIYSDAILSKYIILDQTLFPSEWHFGNQVYTVATPALAAMFYAVVKDTYLALSLASCIMTSLCIISYIWCIKPFVKNKTILISLLILIGGVTVGGTAYGDIAGLQVFYTMASYYSCYLIGIFVTLGTCFRILNNIPVKKFFVLIVYLLNFALGMQSLRELLVLNLPLFMTLSFGFWFCKSRKIERIPQQKESVFFVAFTLIANICGVLLKKYLVLIGIINQQTILQEADHGVINRVKQAFLAFTNYIGICFPKDKEDVFELCVAFFLILIVCSVIVFIIIDICKNKKITTISFGVVYFIISLGAVFGSGVLIIKLRNIYYFCWYPLVAFSILYLLEKEFKKINFIKVFLIIGLMCISILNYRFLFFPCFKNVTKEQDYYQKVTSILLEDDIEYLYSDWRTEQNVIGTVSRDQILYVTLKFSNNPDDLWDATDYLCSEKWFAKENFDKAYIILSNKSLNALETDFSPEYRRAFMSNLEIIHTIEEEGNTLYFYRGSDKMFKDMIN